MRIVKAAETHFVPVPARQWFVWSSIGGAVAMIGLEAIARWLWKEDYSSLISLWSAVAWGIFLGVMGYREWSLRYAHLPAHGFVSWCTGAATIAVLLGGCLDFGEVRLGGLEGVTKLAGTPAYAINREKIIRLQIEAQGGTRSTSSTTRIGVTEKQILPGGLKMGVKMSSVAHSSSLRFHSLTHPENPGWTITEKDNRLVSDDRMREQPWGGDGLLDVVEEMTGEKFAALERSVLAPTLDHACMDWSRSHGFWARNHNIYFQVSTDDRSFEAHYEWPKWLPWLEWVLRRGLPLMVLSCAVWFLARSTMGSPSVMGDLECGEASPL